MKVLVFQKRFADKVAVGLKTQTVRPKRKRPVKAGDELSLRTWSGRPYRSKQQILTFAICIRTFPCNVGCGTLIVGGTTFRGRARESFAERDGFGSFAEMQAWFSREHGLPFRGVLIQWANK